VAVPTLRKQAQVFRMAQFRLLDVARAVADEINKLLGNRRLRLIHRGQLRSSAQSIPANIREGMGRKPGPHRNQAFRDARGSAEETDEHLRANFADGRLPPAEFWRIHNRIPVVVKMLTTIVDA
jgi:four helix bundle protein